MGVQACYDLDAVPRRRFFISYRRSAEDDRFLAGSLKAGLERAGHQVFIDTDLKVGMEWAAEINARLLDWCDYLVVLLSEHSVTSEMVKSEVRKAHQARSSDGWPIIMPIRVAYDGSLDFDYELDSYLGPLQYLHWDGVEDPQRVIDGVLDALSPYGLHDVRPGPFEQAGPAAASDDGPPLAARHALLRAPGGALRIDDPLYIERRPDRLVEELAGVVGETIVVKAPRQMGKSSLLARYLEGCYRAGKAIVDLKFEIFTDAELADYPKLLQRIAEEIQRGLALDLPDTRMIESQIAFDHFLRDHILRRIDGPVTFAFDGVDRVLGQAFQHDFFSMLRTWHNDRASFRSPWGEVDLALVIATDPYLLIRNSDRSPFNVTDPVELACLDRAKVVSLNERYHRPLTPAQLDALFELLCGHPHLTRLAFHRVVGQGMTFSELVQRAEYSDGPFSDHLRAMLLLLQRQPALLDAFTRLIRDRRWQPDEDTYYRLHSAGLACRRRGRIEPANQLYAKFFGQVQ